MDKEWGVVGYESEFLFWGGDSIKGWIPVTKTHKVTKYRPKIMNRTG